MKAILKHKSIITLTVLSALFQLMCLPAHADVVVNQTALQRDVIQRVHALYESAFYLNADDDLQVSLAANQLLLPTHLRGEQLSVDIGLTNTRVFSARNVAIITLTTDAETRRLAWPIQVSLKRTVWRATRYISQGETLSAKNTERILLPLSSLTPYPLSEPMLKDVVARVSVLPGSILTQGQGANTRQQVLVHQNDTVRLTLKSEAGVRLLVTAVALQSGAKGDRIQVSRRDAEGRKVLHMATVIDENTVSAAI